MQWIEKGMVDLYVASDEVPQGRPYPYMIENLMKRAKVPDAAQVIKVGDTMVDIQEGRMSNCGLVAAVTTGAYSREELQEYEPDIIVDRLSELENYIH